MTNSIEVQNLIKKYKGSKELAVDDISFNVKEGEFFAFLGPNGAGKTTTISILTTTLTPTSGQVLVNGYDITKNSEKVRERTGIIFQKPSLDLNLTGEQNIRFHCVLYGLYDFAPTFNLMNEKYKKKVNALSEMIGIEKDLFKATKTYSGGMKRKLEIIRSLMHNPKILFLDEPTVGLDPESRQNLWSYLKEVIKNAGMTVFLTTHYLEEAEDANTICIINKGKIVAHGSPDQIKSKLTKQEFTINLHEKDLDRAKIELKILGYNFAEFNHSLIVDVKEFSDTKKIINSMKTPIESIEIKKPSLEDAYISIIKEEINK